MAVRKTTWVLAGVTLAGLCVFVSTLAAQMPWRVYASLEGYDNVPVPTDYMDKTEWVFARLMYPVHPRARFSRNFGFGGNDWRQGGTSWTQDYPRADRHFSMALRRLTRLNVRSVEQPVNLDDGDDVFNWPWLVAGEMGDWKLTDAQVVKLRDYLLRGGFLYLDDFWGQEEWDRFNESMSAVFPDRPIVEIENADPIFHSVYDLDDRYQILGQWALGRGGGGQRDRWVGTKAHWQGIYDDHQRLMVAMSFNSDIGDSWEWADDPGYPEKFSALGIRIGVNYVMYDITH
jgi:Domain of unknown function (DUF4159)